MTRINVCPVQELTRDSFLELFNNFGGRVLTIANYIGTSKHVVYNLMKKFNIKAVNKPGMRFNISPLHSHPLYKRADNTYRKMKSRCYNPKNKDYQYYGGRGICVSQDWLDSKERFIEDCLTLDNAFKKEFTMDRIDNNGNYELKNIRFVKHKEQCNNRRSNRLYTINGETLTIAGWCDRYNLSWTFVRDRLNLGFTIEQALTLPKNKRHKDNKNDKN